MNKIEKGDLAPRDMRKSKYSMDFATRVKLGLSKPPTGGLKEWPGRKGSAAFIRRKKEWLAQRSQQSFEFRMRLAAYIKDIEIKRGDITRLAKHFKVSPNTISRHLAILRGGYMQRRGPNREKNI